MKTARSPSPKPSSRTSARRRSGERAGIPEPPRASRKLAPLTLDPRGLPPPGTPALVAVSGGRDSVALLHALVERGERALTVCHYDHALRPESAAEAEFVAGLARQCGLACETERRSVPARRKQSVETAARESRYAFFSTTAARLGIAHLYLAHHADDQAETFLWNLLRGSGAAGLRAMRPTSQRGSLTLHRPLLGTPRAEIDAYLAAHALQHCEDPSNVDLQHTRNRLRHDIIPYLESALGRPVRRALARAAEIVSAEDEHLASLVPPLPVGLELDLALLRALPLALQRRAVHAWLTQNKIPHIGFDDIESTLGLLTQKSPAKVNFSSNRHVRRRSGKLILC